MSKGIVFKNRNNEKIYPCPYFPVGSIYMSLSSTNPSTYFGGTWVQVKDRFLLGAGDTYKAGNTGGSSTANLYHKHTTGNCTLTTSQIPAHSHWEKFISSDGNANSYVRKAGTGSNQGVYYANQTAWVASTGQPVYTNDTGGSQAHNHGDTGYAGSSSQSIMPPYYVVYIWRRTA